MRAPTPHAVRLKLDRRIHNQRLALRTDWQINDQRAHARQRRMVPDRFTQMVLRLWRENRDLRAALAITPASKGEME